MNGTSGKYYKHTYTLKAYSHHRHTSILTWSIGSVPVPVVVVVIIRTLVHNERSSGAQPLVPLAPGWIEASDGQESIC